MKKVFMMLALMAIPFVMQGQTKFHDAEAHEARGPVKKITQTVMGQERVTTFTKEGKMEGTENVVYDDNGYLQQATIEAGGMKMTAKYKWVNDRVVSTTMNMMGREFTSILEYNDNGKVVGMTMDMGGQEMKIPYTDIKYDNRGNWISRKSTIMGREEVQTRTIEYYE